MPNIEYSNCIQKQGKTRDNHLKLKEMDDLSARSRSSASQ
jgi:hypothetical protein